VVGCSTHTVDTIVKKETIKDLKDLPQNIEAYTKNIDNGYISTEEKFEKDYFRVWSIEKISISLKDAMWAFDVYNSSNSYGENLKKHTKSFFKQMRENSNFDSFSTINSYAISLDNLNIRAFPTQKPVFMDPSKAGEGFPFDYMQNSTIAANKPLFVSHYSKDKRWVFVESSFTFGWVKAKDIAFIDKKYTSRWKKAKQLFFTEDGIPIYGDKNNFLFYSRVGMVLPLVSQEKENYKVLTVSKNNDIAYYNISTVPKSYAHLGILKQNSKNIEKIINGMKYTKYGWGGLYDQRDCSSTIRDFFIPFGIWLPRNSYKQSISAEYISLKNYTNKEKLDIIKSQAVAFKTLLYKRGHIVLYIGVRDDNVVVYQNLWGIKTYKDEKEGRFIVGKTVFSTLEIGKNLKYKKPDASILSQLQSMTKL
jgi:hypothetical protein